MFVRDSLTATMLLQQNATSFLGFIGDAVDDADEGFSAASDGGADPYLNAIRAISVPMGMLRKKITAELNAVSNADATVDVNQLAIDLRQMDVYTSQLSSAIQAFKASSAYRADAQTAAELDNWMAFLIDWAQATLSAIGQLPTDAANYLAQQAGNLGKAATTAVIPWLIGGGIVLAFVLQAEKSRTYRRVVA